MIYKRVAARLQAQDWLAITIEFAIVVAGVFVGTWVANLNQGRVEEGETRQMLRNLKPELANNIAIFNAVENYYAVTRRYAATAFAGWRGDQAVTDRDFVIAAYQASQIVYTGINGSSWSEAFGSDRLRTISDRELQRDVGQMMSTDYNAIEKELFTDYREHVRQVIPEDIQDAIRARCGDRRNAIGVNQLPASCSIDIPDSRLAQAASALRDRPDLVGELRWHIAAVASYVNNLQLFEDVTGRAVNRIGSAS
ncbi:MAG: hypothetical protein ABIR87_06455 [Sphingomicrobium sp.]